jgi:hypothetical protein
METQQFITRIRRLHYLQPVTVTFAKTGTAGVARLLRLINSDSRVSVTQGEEVVLFAIATSGEWGHDRNRTLTIYGLPAADDAWLCEIARDIDRVEVPDHGAKGLMSSRLVMQKEAMETISRQVITPSFRREMEDWGVTIQTDLLFDNGFPCLRFSLIYSDETVGSAGVDGFSGRIMLNGSFEDKLYMMPHQLQKLMSEWVERLMDKLTQVA